MFVIISRVFRSVLLTGSWRPEKSLQLWDMGTGKLMQDVYWLASPMLYTVQFSPDGSLIAAGGTGANEARVFEGDGSHRVGLRLIDYTHLLYLASC